MTTRGILIIVGIFFVGFLLLGLGKCGYRKIEVFQSMDTVIAHVRREFPEVLPIDGDTLRLYLSQEPPPLLIDVRREEEYALSHLPGAISLTSAGAVRAHLAKADPPVGTVVLYGSLGLRSGKVARELPQNVSAKLFHLEGGIFQWANQGGDLVTVSEDPAGPIAARQVHPSNSIWGRLLNSERRAEVETEESDAE